MGQLKPNTKYIYESPDNGKTVYAREENSTDRILIGYTYNPDKHQYYSDDDKIWYEIRAAARENTALHNALEQCKILYHLSKKDEPLFWHPV